MYLLARALAYRIEITTVKYINTEEGIRYYSIFIKGSLVSFTTTYYKGYSFSRRVKIIYYYIPKEVGELVVYFLSLGQPFIYYLQILYNYSTKKTAFLWQLAPEVRQNQEGDKEEDNNKDDEQDNNNKGEEEGEGEGGGIKKGIYQKRKAS